jgi:hypothetical protein
MGTVNLNIFVLVESGGCPLVVTPYEVEESVTVPTSGAWLLRVVEIRNVVDRPPLPDDVLEIPLSVSGTVADDGTSWSSLKALFR